MEASTKISAQTNGQTKKQIKNKKEENSTYKWFGFRNGFANSETHPCHVWDENDWNISFVVGGI